MTTWSAGDKVFYLEKKDDIRCGLVNKVCKTVVYVGEENKKIGIESVYLTYEEAVEANKHYTKKKGKTEVYPFWNLEDIKKMLDYFHEHSQHKWELAFNLGLMIARRVDDLLMLKWRDFYYENYKRRNEIEIEEEKTGKYTRMYIPPYAFTCLEKYAQEMDLDIHTCIDEDADIFPSNSNRRDAAYRVAFTKAADAVGIEYPVSTHSVRKTFGLWSRRLHPQDVNGLQILQQIFNHSSEAVTLHYIGIDALEKKRYIADMADMVENIGKGNTNYTIDNSPVVSIKSEDLRRILQDAYLCGKQNVGADGEGDLTNMNKLLTLVEKSRIPAATM